MSARPQNPDMKYVAAYEGILTFDELRKAEAEAAEFAGDLPPLKNAPGLTRQIIGRLSDSTKIGAVDGAVKKSDKQGRNYSGVVGEVFDSGKHKHYAGEKGAEGKADYEAKLNYQNFVLNEQAGRLHKSDFNDMYDLFRGDEKDWPTLVLTSNSNLTSPQSFFDTFLAAHELIPGVVNLDTDNMVVAGTYFSQRHAAANAADTIRRYHELNLRPQSSIGMSPAAEAQAYQVLDLLLERDEKGAVTVEGNKPVLRPDAYAVLQHIVGYGYSAGHMTNKDAFRFLHKMIADGDVKLQWLQDGELITKDSTKADADRLISAVRLVGVAGMDRMDITPANGAPAEVNFVSEKDFSLALNGPRYLKAPNVVTIEMRDSDDAPIEDKMGGHAQRSYVEAILSEANAAQCEQASITLSRPGGRATAAR